MGFFQPKKDRCDLCCSYEVGQVSEADMAEHNAKKLAAREAKNQDKSEENPNHSVWTMDVQAVLICPRLNASALYYKTKLASHNFTMFNVKTKEVKCFFLGRNPSGLIIKCVCYMHSKNPFICNRK